MNSCWRITPLILGRVRDQMTFKAFGGDQMGGFKKSNRPGYSRTKIWDLTFHSPLDWCS